QGHVLADLPVLLTVAGDHERSGPALPGRVIEVVQLGAPDTQLAGRQGQRFVPGYRVEEIADATMSRRAELAGHLAPNRLRVVPPPHRGAADLRVVAVILTAAVEQAEQVVGGQWPVSEIERARFGRRHRGHEAGLGGRAGA